MSVTEVTKPPFYALYMIHISGKEDVGNVDCSYKSLIVSGLSKK